MLENHKKLSFDLIEKSNLTWLKERTLYLSRHGSHAYGTNTPTSDLDVRGFAIPPKEYFYGYLNKFEQFITNDSVIDLVVFDLIKFIELCTDGNPNALEILFTEPEDHLHVMPAAEILLDKRKLFLSKKLKHTLSGYAYGQLKRLNSHREFILRPILIKPTREDFNLVPVLSKEEKQKIEIANSFIKKQIDRWDLDFEPLNEADRLEVKEKIISTLTEMMITADVQYQAAARKIGFEENFIHLLVKEREFAAAIKKWEQYQHWLETRNPERAKLEEKYHYDTKHAGHLVRLLTCCEQTLKTGEFKVKREDREFLLAIRNGMWSYEELIEFAEKQNKICEELYYSCNILPKEPSRKEIEKICISIIEESLR